jgi:superfamily II DNA/RNA helicase
MTFNELGLNAHMASRLDALRLTHPTPIQQQAIPQALQGRDILGIAQTGTGKTAAFGIPLVMALSKRQERRAPRSARGLVLAPTRELAGQIVQSLQGLTKVLRITLVVGGKSIKAQAEKLSRGTDILVATPGRLIDLLDGHRDDRTLVFSRTKHGAERLIKHRDRAGFAATSIHGNKSQGQRDRAIAAFKAGSVRVLVATDVAARRIDIPGVGHVYNYDLPNVPENYVHRIGRTARAGREGRVIAFCAADEVTELKAIEKVLGTRVEVAGGRPWDAMNGTPKPQQKRRTRRRSAGHSDRMAA